MEIGLLQYLIVCPLVFLAGFVDAVAGGGGLISLPAYLIAGLPVHFAIGTNKLSSGLGTILATWRFSKNGYIQWKQAGLCVVAALIGSSCGARLALMIPDHYFKMLMLVILPLTGLYIMNKKDFEDGKKSLTPGQQTMYSLAIALFIGMYDGFYGPGTGTFLILLLTSVAGLALSSANGIAKVINLTTNLTALVVFFINGKCLVVFGLIAGAFSILGNYFGAMYFEKKGGMAVKPIMLTVLAIFFVKLVSEIWG